MQIASTDGFTDRHNVFQGARVYDYEADQWTSPDTAAGSLDDPMSFRRYLYDNGNSNIPIALAMPAVTAHNGATPSTTTGSCYYGESCWPDPSCPATECVYWPPLGLPVVAPELALPLLAR